MYRSQELYGHRHFKDVLEDASQSVRVFIYFSASSETSALTIEAEDLKNQETLLDIVMYLLFFFVAHCESRDRRTNFGKSSLHLDKSSLRLNQRLATDL